VSHDERRNPPRDRSLEAQRKNVVRVVPPEVSRLMAGIGSVPPRASVDHIQRAARVRDDLERGQPQCRLDHPGGGVDSTNAGCLRDEQVAACVVGDVVRAVHLRLRGGTAVAARGRRPVAGDQLVPPRGQIEPAEVAVNRCDGQRASARMDSETGYVADPRDGGDDPARAIRRTRPWLKSLR
jgi:hypothetical protein